VAPNVVVVSHDFSQDVSDVKRSAGCKRPFERTSEDDALHGRAQPAVGPW
jgi:hypothetical protein